MHKKWVSLIAALAVLAGVSAAPANVTAANPQTFTVVLKGEAVTESALAAVAKAGGTVVNRIDEVGALQVTATNPGAFLKAVLKSTEIDSIGPSLSLDLNLPETVEPAAVGASPANPADPATYLWGMDRITGGGKAWAIHSGTKNVTVGVIDSGIDLNHPDLKANIVPGSKTFVPGTIDANDQNSHGTHVAGTIAANGAIKGVAPGVGLRSYRVFGASGGAQQVWITDAIVAAANDGVDVINMSLGGFRVHGQWYYNDPVTKERFRLGGDTADVVAYRRAINYAVKKGVTVVAAAGNEGWNLTKRNTLTEQYEASLHAQGYTEYELQGATVNVPGGIPGVITVSAMGGGYGTSDRLAYYSNFGTGMVDVAGPGGDVGPDQVNLEPDYYKYFVLSTVPTNMACNLPNRLFGTCNYGFKVGTSMAAPHVSGVAALYISNQFALIGKKPSPAQVVTALQRSAEDIGKVGADGQYGHGLVNAYRILGGK
jgi:lantibiotic leader peptide-processing serine protease